MTRKGGPFAPKRWAAEHAKLDAMVIADCRARGGTEHEGSVSGHCKVPSPIGPIVVDNQWSYGKADEWLDVKASFEDWQRAASLGLPSKRLPTYMFASMRSGEVTAEKVFESWKKTLDRYIDAAARALARETEEEAAAARLREQCKAIRARWAALGQL
jgi:hypothetical protein